HRSRLEARRRASPGESRKEAPHIALAPSLRSHRPSDGAPARRLAHPIVAATLRCRPPPDVEPLAVAHQLHALLPPTASNATPYGRMQSGCASPHWIATLGGREASGSDPWTGSPCASPCAVGTPWP